jgi:hypothetical protein
MKYGTVAIKRDAEGKLYIQELPSDDLEREEKTEYKVNPAGFFHYPKDLMTLKEAKDNLISDMIMYSYKEIEKIKNEIEELSQLK